MSKAFFQKVYGTISGRQIAILGALLLLIATTTYLTLTLSRSNPVPEDIQNKLNFSVVFPESYTVKDDSWHYSSEAQTLTFAVTRSDYQVLFTEQKTPLTYQDDPAAYNRFIGRLKPSITFKVRLGEVSIARFISEGKFEDEGKSGILNTRGTMLVAHPSRDLSDDEWRELFNSLVVYR